ncbi:MAG: hypothetical protein WD076_05315 [Parvularculaceae bacterium]
MIRILTAALILAASPALADHKPGHDHHGDASMTSHDGNHGATATPVADTTLGPATEKLTEAIAAGGELIVADVLGVVCDFCAVAMNKTFAKRAEVAATYVDLDTKTLSIVTKPGAAFDDETITKLVTKAGYKVAAIRRGAAALEPPKSATEE